MDLEVGGEIVTIFGRRFFAGRRRLSADCSIPDRPDILQGNMDPDISRLSEDCFS